ncbi:MAG: hypothetical protein R3194_00325 [Limnobacter sp.]|nr:hypothetical protein [Limnobacter sp.]
MKAQIKTQPNLSGFTAMVVSGLLFCYCSVSYSVDLRLEHTLSNPAKGSVNLLKSVPKPAQQPSPGFEITSDRLIQRSSLEQEFSLVTHWAITAVDKTKNLLGQLKAPSISLGLHDRGSGIILPLSNGNRFVIGHLSPQIGRFYETERTGFYWLNRVSSDSSFYVGVQKNSSDAKEVTSGVGMVYELN